MLWLADENVEVETVRALRHTGYEVNAIRETCPGVLDPEVMRIAEEDDCVIITEDLGFGEMVFKDRMSTVGVVLLRQHAGRRRPGLRISSKECR